MLPLVCSISFAWILLNSLAVDECNEQSWCDINNCDNDTIIMNCQTTCGYCQSSCLCAQVLGSADIEGFYEWDALSRCWAKVNSNIVMGYQEPIEQLNTGLRFIFRLPGNLEGSWFQDVDPNLEMWRPKDGEFSNGDTNVSITINCETCPGLTASPTYDQWISKDFFIYIEPFSMNDWQSTEKSTKLALDLDDAYVHNFQLFDWRPLQYWENSQCASDDCVATFIPYDGTLWGLNFSLEIMPTVLTEFNYKVSGDGWEEFQAALIENLNSAGLYNRSVSLFVPSSEASGDIPDYKNTTILVVTLIGLCFLLAFFYYFRCLKAKNELQFHPIEVGNTSNSRTNWTKEGESSGDDEDINYRSSGGRRWADRKREEIWKNIVGTWTMGSRVYEVRNDGMGDYMITQSGAGSTTTRATITEEGRFSIDSGRYTAYFSNNKLIWADGDTWTKRSIEDILERRSESSDDGSSSSEEDEYDITCWVTKPDGEREKLVESVSGGILVSQLQRQLATRLAGVSKNNLLIFARRNDDVPISSEWRLEDANIRDDEVYVDIAQRNVMQDEMEEAWDAFN